jgi:hypothetical protein
LVALHLLSSPDPESIAYEPGPPQDSS